MGASIRRLRLAGCRRGQSELSVSLAAGQFSLTSTPLMYTFCLSSDVAKDQLTSGPLHLRTGREACPVDGKGPSRNGSCYAPGPMLTQPFMPLLNSCCPDRRVRRYTVKLEF